MRISNKKAEELARHISQGFMVPTMKKVRGRFAEIALAVLRSTADPADLQWLQSVPEDMRKYVKSPSSGYRITLPGQSNRWVYPGELGILEWPAEARAWGDITLERKSPNIRLYDQYAKAKKDLEEAELGTKKLYQELLANIKGAGTVKRLLEAWPEQRAAIEEFFGTAAHGTCQTPLESILQKYQNLALPAPTEGEPA